MRIFIGTHALLGIAFSLIILTWGDVHSAQSFAAGAGLSFLNIALIAFSWSNILEKKLVALSVGVIVIKFAILGWIIYEVVNRRLFYLGWFTAGLALVVVSTVATALWFAQQNPEKAEDQ